MVSESIIDSDAESVPFDSIGGAYLFDSIIPEDTTRMLCLYKECLLYPTSDMEEISYQYISMRYFQLSRHILNT